MIKIVLLLTVGVIIKLRLEINSYFIDETIIKRKLLIDGDGIGDDRRINIGLKQFVKWCNTDDETPDEKYVVM